MRRVRRRWSTPSPHFGAAAMDEDARGAARAGAAGRTLAQAAADAHHCRPHHLQPRPARRALVRQRAARPQGRGCRSWPAATSTWAASDRRHWWTISRTWASASPPAPASPSPSPTSTCRRRRRTSWSARPPKSSGPSSSIRRGLITDEELYNKIVELWTRATDEVTDAVKDLLSPIEGLGAMARPAPPRAASTPSASWPACAA